MAAVHRDLRRRLLNRAFFGPERRFEDRQNPLESLSPDEVFRRYRFRPETVLLIVGIFANNLAFDSGRNMPLPPLLQVCIFLRHLATGSFQLVVGDTLLVSQSTVCRCCRRVGRLLSRKTAEYVRFPDPTETAALKQKFRRIAGFPNVIGCIDGTHIRIKTPKEHENEYVNRKGFHSLNVQMICDPDFRITNLIAKWPGSTHDARMWRECALRQQFENGAHIGFLLGDSGYACKSYMLTPFLNPQTPSQNRFNGSLCRTRVLIEQTYGILKKRFPILHFGIRAEPNVAVHYISSCVILHNIGILHGDIIEHDIDMVDNVIDDIIVNNVNDLGNAIRQQIADRFFNY